MGKLFVRGGLRLSSVVATLMIVLFSEAPTAGERAGAAPHGDATASRVEQPQTAASAPAREESVPNPATADAAQPSEPNSHVVALSFAGRIASLVLRFGAEQLASLALPPPALDQDEPSETPPAVPPAAERTAVYDIAAHAVYLPNGDKLEAHSGLGQRLDDPRYVNVRNRGPTPPNVYDLVPRRSLFHGVQALRLVPVNQGKMFGRDGILAHSYMHGGNGQSNGCVVFRDYGAFLNAFLRGDVERLVVVERLEGEPDPLPAVAPVSAANHLKRRVRHIPRSPGRGRYAS
jgi:Protein of unknown function (DUF2778)